MTAVNDQGGEINKALDVDGGEDTIPRTMQKYKERGEGWMLVVDDNCMFFSRFLLAIHPIPPTLHFSNSLYSPPFILKYTSPSLSYPAVVPLKLSLKLKANNRWRGIST
jgi:hypothetical protein